MGKLNYDAHMTALFDDRVLAHLQVVMCTKLGRGESFPFTWKEDPATGGGRTTVWVNPSRPLRFVYHGSRAPSLNRAWLEALMATANSSSGLRVVAEPPED